MADANDGAGSRPPRAGHLPPQLGTRFRLTSGAGELCGMCEEPVEKGEMQYELWLEESPGQTLWRFHALCFRIWESAGGVATPE